MSIKKFNLRDFRIAKSSKRKELAAEVDALCRESGFLLLSGHGVPPDVIGEQWRAVSSFFSQSQEIKTEVSVPYPGYPYGWIGPNKEALAASKGVRTLPDLKESFNGGPLTIPLGILDKQAYEFCYQPTLFPKVNGFKKAWISYYGEMESLAKEIMEVFALALGLETNYFNEFINHPISALRALNYPPIKNFKNQDQQRAGAHTDYGSLTILLPEPKSSGLQIFRRGKWIDVPSTDDCFIINIGDLMELWTSNRWVSTLHRVVAQSNQPGRLSLAFFHQPDWDAEIKPIFNEAQEKSVKSGPYLMKKFLSATN